VAQFAVNGDEIFRLDQAQQQLQLLLAGVAADVDVVFPAVDDPGPAAEEVVDGPTHQLLVAGNDPGRHHHRVAGLNADVAMLAGGHPAQGRARLPLAAGGNNGDLMVRPAF
jgi:hypothetical protein